MSSSSCPSLLYCYYANNSDNIILISMLDGSCEHKTIEEWDQNTTYVPATDGWLFLNNTTPDGECFLFNPTTLAKVQLPPLQRNIVQVIVASSSPFKIFILNNSTPNYDILSWEEGDKEWKLHHVLCDDTSRINFILFSNGKLYGLKDFSLVAINLEDPATAKLSTLAVLDEFVVEETSVRDRWLVESSRGEIVLVLVTCLRSTSSMSVNVYKADLSKKEFMEVDSVGDEAIFVEPYIGFMCPVPVQSGFRRDCVYILMEADVRLFCYDVEDGSISVAWPSSKDVANDLGPSWNLRQC